MVKKFIVQENKNSLHIPYPMAFGYSDIFCVKKENLFEFARLCGIFAAMNLFVEIAIPTAAVLAFERDEVKFFDGEDIRLWTADAKNNFAERFGYDYDRLHDEWDEKINFVHPVKLSGWRI